MRVGCLLKRVLGPMRLELQVTVCCLTRVLASGLRSSERAAQNMYFWNNFKNFG